MSKIWVIPESIRDTSLVEKISKDFSIHPIAAGLMVQRGVEDFRRARIFINSGLKYTHSPFLLKDLDIAVARIRRAIDRKERVLIYGDRDVDGVTSITIMYSVLKDYGLGDVIWLLPQDGYGLGKVETEQILSMKPSLVITVDNGICGETYIKVLAENGIDVIVTDHHEPISGIPGSAIAVLDPKRADCRYPFKNLAGCGVAFKLCLGLVLSYDEDFLYDKMIVCYDFETTGLNGSKDEVIEIGAVKVKNSVVIDTFNVLLKPDSRVISAEVEAITGLTKEMIEENGISQGEGFRKFSAFIDDCYLMGHNSDKFDSIFLKNSFSRKNIGYPRIHGEIDTIKLSRQMFPRLKHNLAALSEYFDITEGEFHRALSDAKMTLNLYYCLVLNKSGSYREFFARYLDLLTLGTVSDVMPLVDENRIFVKWGLKCLTESKRPGLQALLKTASLTRNLVTARNISFSLAPRINSTNRMGVATKSVELLLTDDRKEAERLAGEIEELNSTRRDRTEEYTVYFEEELLKTADIEHDLVIVVAVSGIEHGVTGIVASRLAEKYCRPVIAMVIDEVEGKKFALGSARSFEDCPIIGAFEENEEILKTFGGHKSAVGFTIDADRIDLLRSRMLQWGRDNLTSELLVPRIYADWVATISELDPKLYKELRIMEPFGLSNPEPLFVLKDLIVSSVKKLGENEKHLKIIVESHGKKLECLFWNSSESHFHTLSDSKKIDLVGRLELNSWLGMQKIQLIVEDYKVS